MTDELAATVGARIKAARAKAGLTQKDIAQLVNVRENDVRRWETGRNLPATSRLPQLAAALGVTLDWLFSEEPDEAAADEPGNAKSGPAATPKRRGRSRLNESPAV